MVNFHNLERMIDRVVGSTFSEKVKFIPQTKNGGRSDNERPPQDISGVLHFPDEQGEVDFRLGDSRSGVDSKITGVDAAFVIERSEYPNLSVLKGDLMRGLDAPGQPWFSVVKVNTNLSSIIVVNLVNDARSAK